jgi:uncharacterized protein
MNEWPVRLARFGGALRAHGVGTSLRDELDGAEALAAVDAMDREEVRAALRIAFKIRRSDFETFDQLFAPFWSDEPRSTAFAAPPAPRRRDSRMMAARVPRWDPDARRMLDAPSETADGQQPGYSPEAALRRKSFDEVAQSERDLAAIERLLVRLARRLATRRGRRLVPTRSRGRPDLRASFKRALRTSGEIVTFARRTRAVDKPRLAFLCDTSGSMEAHTPFLLMFALALRRAVSKVELFAFNTELVRLNPALSHGDLRLALDRLRACVRDWSGGTRIGDSLAAFVHDHLEQCVDSKTVVVIVSDGLDRGDPVVLADAVRAVRRRARKVVWLNPLLGDPRYQPLTRGMEAALPFIDHFAAAHNVESLERALSCLAGRP